MNFEIWIKKVDQCIRKEIGMGKDDIPDNCYRDMHETGWSPQEAAKQTLKEVYYVF